MLNLDVLTVCEESGIVRDAFLNQGYSAMSCDLKPTSKAGPHVQMDALQAIEIYKPRMVVGFPPCTYLAKVQLFRCVPGSDYLKYQLAAGQFAVDIFNSGVELVVLENPEGALTKYLGNYDQLIRPWYFGSDFDKSICLWLKNLPPLIGTCYSTKRRSRANQVNSRMSQALKSEIKSKFFPEVADAMVQQWGKYLCV